MELLRELFTVADVSRERIGELLAEFDLTASMVEMLWALDPDAPPVPMRALAHRLRCDPSNVTLLINRLESTGLVARAPHPTDRRARVILLTVKGREVWARLMERLELTSPVFTLDDDERQQLNSLLLKVTSRLG